MEARKITVVQTKNQKKSVIMSAATTLAELKSDLRANGIDYDGMTFFEGTTKVELNTNKKIRSGAVAMSRTEAYSAIKSMGLQDACVKKFGKNFTMCKTADLIALVQSNSAAKPAPAAPKAEAKKEETPVNTPELNEAPSEEYKPKSASPYSDDEIDDMFAGMGVN